MNCRNYICSAIICLFVVNLHLFIDRVVMLIQISIITGEMPYIPLMTVLDVPLTCRALHVNIYGTPLRRQTLIWGCKDCYNWLLTQLPSEDLDDNLVEFKFKFESCAQRFGTLWPKPSVQTLPYYSSNRCYCNRLGISTCGYAVPGDYTPLLLGKP